ncbi:MAG: glycosyltransferase [Bacteroidales bacterium]|nr:glycosyltransferase [Bacteroidales bacterium]
MDLRNDIADLQATRDNPEEPLVSIIVITYNSAKYVVETFESAKAQTYKNIELIISDDCSTDDTVEICRKWLSENSDRFVRTALITVEKNTGIPANCNRGLRAAQGEWIKFIAGDDLLYSNCIETIVSYIDKETKILLCEINDFHNIIDFMTSYSDTGNRVNSTFIKLDSAEKQFIYFLKGFYVPGSGLFFERKKLNESGAFEEKYKFVEDRPLLLKYTYNYIKIKYIPYVLVGHRRHPAGVTAKGNETVHVYLMQVYDSILHYSKKAKKRFFQVNAIWHILLITLIFSSGNKGFFCDLLNILRLKFQPLRFYNLLVKIHLIKE